MVGWRFIGLHILISDIFLIYRHLTNEQKVVIRPVFENNREDILKYNREILEQEFEEC